MATVARQRTLKDSIHCTGTALHGGGTATMVLEPAPADSGIVFHRSDLATADQPGPAIPARWDRVCDAVMSTTLGNDDGITVGTVEHLMAAFAGSGIDNVAVHLDGPEVPIMDGSAAPFVFLIECAGTQEQAARRRSLRLLREVCIEDGDRRVSLSPSEGFQVSFEIEFASPAIARSEGSFDLANGGFKRDICRARTFGFERDVEALWAHGLALGGSLDNVVVVGNDDSILNDEGLRYTDEFVRHKVLDAVGDLYLAGAPILGHFRGIKSGHAMNNRLLRALFADPESFEYCDQAPRAGVGSLGATDELRASA